MDESKISMVGSLKYSSKTKKNESFPQSILTRSYKIENNPEYLELVTIMKMCSKVKIVRKRLSKTERCIEMVRPEIIEGMWFH